MFMRQEHPEGKGHRLQFLRLFEQLNKDLPAGIGQDFPHGVHAHATP
jgi:hypothetical protein